MKRAHWATHLPWLALLVTAAPPMAQQAPGSVLPVATCEQLGPRELQVSVTFFNCGASLDRDYAAFLHFDRSATGESLYVQSTPGLRPLVAPTQATTWSPNEITVVQFPSVTVPASVRADVFVKVGLYDAGGSAARLPLAGEDATHRVLVGRLVVEGEACRFVRRPPGAREGAERIGARPRAFVRPMPVPPAVRFGEIDLAAWRVEGLDGGSATGQRTREELCWSEASLKLTYTGEGHASGFVLRPPEPLPVPEEADVARLWLLGRAHGWAKRRTEEQPLLRHWLEFEDADGATRRLTFRPAIAYPYWFVARKRLPADWPRPLACTGVGFAGCTNTRPRSLLLDALVFAKEALAPELTTEVRLDDLTFPTSPDGLLPDPPDAEYQDRVGATEDVFELVYAGADEHVRYIYRPLRGTLDDIEAAWSAPGESGPPQRFRPAAEGGPIIRLGGRTHYPSSPGVRRTPLATDAGDDRITTTWRCEAPGGATEYTLALSLRAKSLLIEIDAADEAVTGFAPGHFDGPAGARFVFFPYWSWGVWDYGRDGGVVVSDRVFISGFPDWYRSRASRLTFGAPLSHRPEALTASALTYVPGVTYDARTDGRRNLLRERYIFTVSSEVREVLPNIPHPPSPHRDKLAPYCHYTGGQASRLAAQLEDWRRLKSYGVDKVYIRHFDGMWSDIPQGPQEWTLTQHAAPLVGDVAMRSYLDELRGLGFLPVLYTNYTDLQPIAAEFEWDKIKLLPDGDISDFCWPGSYPLKPLRAVELEAQYAPRIAQRFGSEGSFCDVHTAAVPWGKVDFDARLPGAAQFGTTYRCYGKLLLNEREVYGAVYSEGSVHWLYAGLADGSDAQIRSPHPHREPFLVDFDLLKIHPLEMDAGMSWISRYVESPEDEAELGGPEAAQDRFTAATIAFGHQGAFTRRRFRGYDTDIKTYYMLQPLQTLYAMRRAELIQYRDPADGRSLSSSEALRSGAYRESQVHVRYDNGLEVWVNGSFTSEWPLEVDGVTYRLPPSGFVCRGPDVLVYSALGDGGRVDYAAYDGTRFVDARGARQIVADLETDGAALLKQAPDGTWSLWPLGDVTALKLAIRALKPDGVPRVSAYDESGEPLGEVETAVDQGWLTLPADQGAFRFEIAAQ